MERGNRLEQCQKKRPTPYIVTRNGTLRSQAPRAYTVDTSGVSFAARTVVSWKGVATYEAIIATAFPRLLLDFS